MERRRRGRLGRGAVLAALAGTLLLGGCGGDDVPEEVTPAGDREAGRMIFLETAQPSCGDCHTLADAGTTGTIGVNLDQRRPSHDEVAQAVRTGPDAMPPYAEQLSDEQIDDVAAYVSQVAGNGG